MCGIIYAHGTKKVSTTVLKKYKAQRHRGYEGFGFVSFTDKKVNTYMRHQTEKEMEKELRDIQDTHVLFHHRYPTSTENVPECAHPIKVAHTELRYQYYVVHNGVITNASELKLEHNANGYEYTTELHTEYRAANGNIYHGAASFNDSESLAVEIARNIEKNTPIRAKGSIAFIALQCDGKKVRKLFFGTNGGNPLTMHNDGTRMTVSSEGGGKDIKEMTMYTHDYATHKTTESPLDIPAYPKPSMGFKYYPTVPTRSDDDDETPTIAQLERALDEIETDISIAQLCNELDEKQELEIERDEIERELEIAYGMSAYSYSHIID